MSDDTKYLRNTIRRIKMNNPELVVTMMLHAGKEYDPWSNKLQRDYCHNAVQMGVELIIGHHPHVV